MSANMRATYMDMVTGFLSYDDFHDPFLEWRRMATGEVYLHVSYCGEPLAWWSAANPRPSP